MSWTLKIQIDYTTQPRDSLHLDYTSAGQGMQRGTYHMVSSLGRYGGGPTPINWCHTLWQQLSLITHPIVPSVESINIGKHNIFHNLEAMLFFMVRTCLCSNIILLLEPLRTLFFIYISTL